MRMAQLSSCLRVTPCGSYLWAPCDPGRLGFSANLDPVVWGADKGDIVMVFRRSKLKLVAVVLKSIRCASTTYHYLARFGLRRSGCCLEIRPLYLRPHCAEDEEVYDQDSLEIVRPSANGLLLLAAADNLTSLEQIRKAQASAVGLSLAHDELKSGRKKGDWVRWIFPSLAGAVVSGERGRYRLTSLGDAAQILRDPELGPGYVESVGLAWKQIVESGLTPTELMGSDADSDELRSSLEVFLEACEMLDADEKKLPGIQEFIHRARQLLEYINPML